MINDDCIERINDFWDFVQNIENDYDNVYEVQIGVEPRNEGKDDFYLNLYLYINDNFGEVWNKFCKEFYIQDDRAIDQYITLMNDYVIIRVDELIRGYSFSMKEIWDYRPNTFKD